MSNTTDARKEPTVCRTCLNVITGFSFRLHENSGLGPGLKFTHILRYIVPELYLGLSQGPEICQNCKQSLKIAYTFRKKCLETETLIGNYLKNVRCTAQVIDLSAVINYVRVYKMTNVQNILSEWNDDSCEDSPLSEVPSLALLAATDSTPSTETDIQTINPDLLTPEIIMTPIPDIRTANNSKQFSTVPKIMIPPLASNVEPPMLSPQVIINPVSDATTSTGQQVMPIIQKVAIPRDPKQFYIYDENSLVKETKLIMEQKDAAATPKNSNQSHVGDENRSVQEQKEVNNPVTKTLEATKENNIEPKESGATQTQTPLQQQEVEHTYSGGREKSVELLKVCPETGLFISKAGKYFNSKGQMLSATEVQALQAKTEEKVHSILHKAAAEMKGIRVRSVESLKEKPKTPSSEQIKEKDNSSTSCETTNAPTFQNDVYRYNSGNLPQKEQTDVEKNRVKIKEEKKENSLNVCEETGLLKDQDGHYFDFYGNPLEREQVDAERKKAKIRGETLFKISNICTVSDEDFSQAHRNANQIPSDFEENIDAHQIPKSGDQDFPKSKQSTNKGKVYAAYPAIKPKKGKPQANRRITIPNSNENDNFVQNLPGDQQGLLIPLRKSILKNTLLTTSPKPVNVLNFMADKNLRIPQQLGPPVQARKDTQHTRNLNISTESSSNPIFSPVRIKEEPVDPSDLNKLLDNSCDNDNDTERTDSEETLSAPDLNDGESGSWQNLINSLDSCENSQYVDVPDFVQINNFTFEDLEKLKVQGEGKAVESACNSWFDNILKHKLKFVPDVEAPSSQNELLPDTFTYRGKRLVKLKNGYKFEDPPKFVAQSISDSNEELQGDPESTIIPISEPVNETKPKSTQPGSDSLNQPKERKRIGPGRGRRKRLKIVPVGDQVDVKPVISRPVSPSPDREICVLFTNYTEDGIYINDHDYLTSPYARNSLLYDENDGKSYCMCYICGKHHLIDQHVPHMKAHESRCDPCCLNMGTPYMLNMHMKVHAKPCKYCTDVIPYPDIESHARKHEEEEEDQEEVTGSKRRRKKNSYDEDEEFHMPGLVSVRRGTRRKLRDSDRLRNTRSRTRTDESSDELTETSPRRKTARLGTDAAVSTPISTSVSPETSGTRRRRRRTRGDDSIKDSPATVENTTTTSIVVENVSIEPVPVSNILLTPVGLVDEVPTVINDKPATDVVVDNTLTVPVVIDIKPAEPIIVDETDTVPVIVGNTSLITTAAVNDKPTVQDASVIIEDSPENSNSVEDTLDPVEIETIKEQIQLTSNIANPYVLLKKMAVIETFWVKKMNNIVLPDTDSEDKSDVQEIPASDTNKESPDVEVVTIEPGDIGLTEYGTVDTPKAEFVTPDAPRKSGRVRRIINEKPIEILSDEPIAEKSSITLDDSAKIVSADGLLEVQKIATYVPHVPKKRGRKPKSFYNTDSKIDVPESSNTTKTLVYTTQINTLTPNVPKKRGRRPKIVGIEPNDSPVIIVPDDPINTADEEISIIEPNDPPLIIVPDEPIKTTADEVIRIDSPIPIDVDAPQIHPINVHVPKKRGRKPKIVEVSNSEIESDKPPVVILADDTTTKSTDDVSSVESPIEVPVSPLKVDPLVIHLPKKRGRKPKIVEVSDSQIESTALAASDETTRTMTDGATVTDITTEVPLDVATVETSTQDSPMKRRKQKLLDISIGENEPLEQTISIATEGTTETTKASVNVSEKKTEITTRGRKRKNAQHTLSDELIIEDDIKIEPHETGESSITSPGSKTDVASTDLATDSATSTVVADQSAQSPSKKKEKRKKKDRDESEESVVKSRTLRSSLIKNEDNENAEVATTEDTNIENEPLKMEVIDPAAHTAEHIQSADAAESIEPSNASKQSENDEDGSIPSNKNENDTVKGVIFRALTFISSLVGATDSATSTTVADQSAQSPSKKKEKRKKKDGDESEESVVKSRTLRSSLKKKEDNENAEVATTEDTNIETNEPLQMEVIDPAAHTAEHIQSGDAAESIEPSNISKQSENHEDGGIPPIKSENDSSNSMI